jgi:hypothetical protein
VLYCLFHTAALGAELPAQNLLEISAQLVAPSERSGRKRASEFYDGNENMNESLGKGRASNT